jgi:hypothetical protein
MKNPRSTGKLTLSTETIAHLRQLAPVELDRARGGRAAETFDDCPKTTDSNRC